MKGKDTGGYPCRGYLPTAKARPQHRELHAQLLCDRKRVTNFNMLETDSIAGMEQVTQRKFNIVSMMMPAG